MVLVSVVSIVQILNSMDLKIHLMFQQVKEDHMLLLTSVLIPFQQIMLLNITMVQINIHKLIIFIHLKALHQHN